VLSFRHQLRRYFFFLQGVFKMSAGRVVNLHNQSNEKTTQQKVKRTSKGP
jgi:ABC-type siderophore export system fused ATPase/permease subunit